MRINPINQQTSFQAKAPKYSTKIVGELSENVANSVDYYRNRFDGFAKQGKTDIIIAETKKGLLINVGSITHSVKLGQKLEEIKKSLWYGVLDTYTANNIARSSSLEDGLKHIREMNHS